uniref:Small hydrophilic protein n=1 Tax=Steinernema glaseri TaxID=37863 RepID=A0A1I8AH90_9BILA
MEGGDQRVHNVASLDENRSKKHMKGLDPDEKKDDLEGAKERRFGPDSLRERTQPLNCVMQVDLVQLTGSESKRRR